MGVEKDDSSAMSEKNRVLARLSVSSCWPYTWMEGGPSLVAQSLKNLPAVQETGFDPWVRKIPWKREWQPTLVFWDWWQRSLMGYSPWGHRVRHAWMTNTHTSSGCVWPGSSNRLPWDKDLRVSSLFVRWSQAAGWRWRDLRQGWGRSQ